MEEQTLLEVADRTVTTSRVVVGEQTFAVRNITAVKMTKGRFSLWHVLGIVLGLALTSIESSRPYGLSFALLMGYVGWNKGRQRTIYLSTSGGEIKAWQSNDAAAAQAFNAAIADAISRR